MGHFRCTTCDAEQTGDSRVCSICRACAVCWHPSRDDIEAGCELARASWSQADYRRRRREPEHGVEILDLYRGSRRVNKREYYDGH